MNFFETYFWKSRSDHGSVGSTTDSAGFDRVFFGSVVKQVKVSSALLSLPVPGPTSSTGETSSTGQSGPVLLSLNTITGMFICLLADVRCLYVCGCLRMYSLSVWGERSWNLKGFGEGGQAILFILKAELLICSGARS